MSPSSSDIDHLSEEIQTFLDANPKLRQWVEELEVLTENQGAELRRRERQILDRSTDAVTGLRTRSDVYVPFERAVTEACGAEFDRVEWSDPSIGIPATDRCTGATGLEETVVLFGDLAYLKAANQGGRHEEGDALLGRVGDAFRALGSPEVTLPDEPLPEAPIVAFRYGGDEFVGYVPGGPDTVRRIVDDLQELVARIDAPVLAQAQLSPRIDVATATLREGATAYRAFLERGFDTGPGKRTNKIVEFAMRIADRRAVIAKLTYRVRYLMECRRAMSAEQFEERLALIARGENVQAREIDDFVKRSDQGEDVGDAIRSFVLGKLEEAFERGTMQQRSEFDIVKSIANPPPATA